MQYQRHVADSLLYSFQSFEAQTFPVCRIYTVDVTNTSSQNVYAQISDGLAFLRICTLASTDYAVFFAADCTDFCFDRQTQLMSNCNQFLGLCQIFFDREVRTVEHDRSKASLDAVIALIVGAVIQMQSNRNGDTQRFVHSLYHICNNLETGHVLAGTAGNAQNYRRIQLLCSVQDCLCPFQIVDVELTDCILAVSSLLHHILCRY